MRCLFFWILLACLLLCCTGGCGSSAAADTRWWPPEQPRQPWRLVLVDPGAAAGEPWWQANVLSQLPEGTYASTAQAVAAAQLIEEANKMRSARGLATVQPLPALNRAAQAHALDQATRDYWSHHTPEGLTSRQRVHAAGGGDVTTGGENSSIGVFGALTPAEIVSGWSTHPGHRELLFNPSVRYAGAGIYCYKDSEYEYFVLLLIDE